MNKGKIKYIAAAAMLCFSAVSCGSKAGSQVTGSTSSGTSATTAETATEAASETTAAATTAAPTEETTAAEVSDEHLADAVRLFEAVNTAEMLRTGAGVETDNELAKEFTVKEHGKDTDMIFFKVTDSRFSSTDDVKKLLSDSFSGTLLEKYKGIYVPVKAGLLKRVFLREMPLKKIDLMVINAYIENIVSYEHKQFSYL